MPSEPATGPQLYHGDVLSPGVAVKLAGAAIFSIYGTQIAFATAHLPILVAALAGDVVVLAWLAVYARRRSLRIAHLGLGSVPGRLLAAGGLVGLGAWFINMWIVAIVGPHSDLSGLEAIIEQPSLPATLVAIALLPAIAEEIVFRGILARALASRLPALAAVGLSSLAFGAYHLIPAQMISTFLLGLVLATLTLRARSAIPAMLAHLLNNAIAILVSRDQLPVLWPWMESHALPALAICAALVAAGMTLALTHRSASA